MDITWSTNHKPNNISPYDHCSLDTPLGKALIEWKSWKERPDFGVVLGNDYIGTEYSLKDAKLMVENHLRIKHGELERYIEKLNGK